jgi:N6-L-threonylcarbamoyladenine synthase
MTNTKLSKVSAVSTFHCQLLGINPKTAVHLHNQNIDKAIETAMNQANMDYSDLTAIAVTRGPGIGICLEVGLTKAKQLVLFILCEVIKIINIILFLFPD